MGKKLAVGILLILASQSFRAAAIIVGGGGQTGGTDPAQDDAKKNGTVPNASPDPSPAPNPVRIPEQELRTKPLDTDQTTPPSDQAPPPRVPEQILRTKPLDTDQATPPSDQAPPPHVAEQILRTKPLDTPPLTPQQQEEEAKLALAQFSQNSQNPGFIVMIAQGLRGRYGNPRYKAFFNALESYADQQLFGDAHPFKYFAPPSYYTPLHVAALNAIATDPALAYDYLLGTASDVGAPRWLLLQYYCPPANLQGYCPPPVPGNPEVAQAVKRLFLAAAYTLDRRKKIFSLALSLYDNPHANPFLSGGYRAAMGELLSQRIGWYQGAALTQGQSVLNRDQKLFLMAETSAEGVESESTRALFAAVTRWAHEQMPPPPGNKAETQKYYVAIQKMAPNFARLWGLVSFPLIKMNFTNASISRAADNVAGGIQLGLSFIKLSPIVGDLLGQYVTDMVSSIDQDWQVEEDRNTSGKVGHEFTFQRTAAFHTFLTILTASDPHWIEEKDWKSIKNKKDLVQLFDRVGGAAVNEACPNLPGEEQAICNDLMAMDAQLGHQDSSTLSTLR